MKKDNGYIFLMKADCNDSDERWEFYFIPLEMANLAAYLYNTCKKVMGTYWEENEELSEEEKYFLRDYIPSDGYGSAHTITSVAIFKRENGNTLECNGYILPEIEFEDVEGIEQYGDVYLYKCSPIELFK